MRTFKINNGLRFVVVHCASVEDARRRALAMAIMTVDRKLGNFVKLFCPTQMVMSTFLRNIQLWWSTCHIKNTLPPNYMNRLLKFTSQNLRDIPK